MEQATPPVTIPGSAKFTPNGSSFSISWQSPPVTFTAIPVSRKTKSQNLVNVEHKFREQIIKTCKKKTKLRMPEVLYSWVILVSSQHVPHSPAQPSPACLWKKSLWLAFEKTRRVAAADKQLVRNVSRFSVSVVYFCVSKRLYRVNSWTQTLNIREKDPVHKWYLSFWVTL